MFVLLPLRRSLGDPRGGTGGGIFALMMPVFCFNAGNVDGDAFAEAVVTIGFDGVDTDDDGMDVIASSSLPFEHNSHTRSYPNSKLKQHGREMFHVSFGYAQIIQSLFSCGL